MRTLTTVYVTGVVARPKEIIKIPVNIRGAAVHFVFDDSWTGLKKNVVFGGVETVAVANAPDIVEIPAEVVGVVGASVSVSICGLSADGTEIIPTLWADLGTVQPSAAGDFPPPAEQGLLVWAQIQRDLNNLTGVVDAMERRISDPGFAPKSDLNQNDPLKNDYILNRTHWVEPVETTVSWDGSTKGRRTYTDSLGTVYYKIADKCPEEEYVLGSTIELSNGNTQTVNTKMFKGFSDGAAKVGGYLYIRHNPIVSAGNVIDTDSVGIYATAGTVYPVAFRYNEIVVHPLDEKFIPASIARRSDLEQNGTGGGSGSGSSQNVDLTGYAKETWVQEGFQPKGEYLTEHQSLDGYAKTEDIPTKAEDIGAQPAGNYLTEVPTGYATEEFVKNKIAEAELGGEEVDLSGYAQKSELPTKVSQLENDSGYLTEHQDLTEYAKKTEIPAVPVQSVNGKTGAVVLDAEDVGARPDTWMPSASDVGALPDSTVIPSVPTKVSAFENDSGYITGYTETDPTVPAWAKQPTKPTYTAAEVGALPATTVIPTVPTVVSAFTNDAGYLTEHQDISGKADKNQVATYITPETYGAKGDGSTDDSAAIQAAIDAAGSANIVYLGRKTYAIETGLMITHSNRRFHCEGKLSYSGTDAAITIGSHTVIANIDEINAPNGTAVKVGYANKYIEKCMITVGRIASSKIGLHLYTDTVSITYNQFKIGYISASDIGVYVECQASYINENWYHLGKITGCATGIKLFSAENLESHTGLGTNDNRFVAGGLEGISTDGCAIHIVNSCGNKFEKMRCQEHYGKNMLVLEGHVRWNDIELTRFTLTEIDISGITGGHSNILKATQICDQYNGYNLGSEARIDYGLGITYDSRFARAELVLRDDLFENNVIVQRNTLIPNALYFLNDAMNGTTYTLGDIYSHYWSMAKGNPVAVTFSETGGRIVLNDINGDVIVDNRDGKYAGKTLSVQWAGYEKTGGKNVWAVFGVDTGSSEVDLDAAINTALAQAKASGEFDGEDGTPGANGADGFSPTVAVSKAGSVTTVSITDKNGTKTATINDGADGSPGSAGKDGTSVTVKTVSESSADGGSNVVTFSDGKTVTIKNGSKGSKGDTGATGPAYTLTSADKSSIAATVKASLTTETWTFTLDDGSTVTKAVYVG